MSPFFLVCPSIHLFISRPLAGFLTHIYREKEREKERGSAKQTQLKLTMAPALTTPAPIPPHHLTPKPAPKSIFPDGIRTSGQHEPLYDLLRPYSAFPRKITGPTAWTKADYENHPEQWTHYFSEAEIAEIGGAADAFIASGTPLTGISRDGFPLPVFSEFLGPLRRELIDGKGFVLFKGLPVKEWGNKKSAGLFLSLSFPLCNTSMDSGFGFV